MFLAKGVGTTKVLRQEPSGLFEKYRGQWKLRRERQEPDYMPGLARWVKDLECYIEWEVTAEF